jgi:hypothetical protein
MLCLCLHSEAADHIHREPDHLGDGGPGDPDVRGAGGPHPQHQLELRGAGLQRGRAGNAFGANAALAQLQIQAITATVGGQGPFVDVADGTATRFMYTLLLNIIKVP